MTYSSRLRRWLIRLIAWDGVLPAVVWSVPFVVHELMPNDRGANEFCGIALPLVAFLVRFFIGFRAIKSNHCGMLLRPVQMTVLCVGLFTLLLIDVLMVLENVMPKGPAPTTWEDLIVLAVLYAIYFSAMAIAMYPGFENRADSHGRLGGDSELEYARDCGEDRYGRF